MRLCRPIKVATPAVEIPELIPGGIWGLDDGVYDRTGTIVATKTGAQGTTQYNANQTILNAQRIELSLGANRALWATHSQGIAGGLDYCATRVGKGHDIMVRGGSMKYTCAENGTCKWWDDINANTGTLYLAPNGDEDDFHRLCGLEHSQGQRFMWEYGHVRNGGDGIQFQITGTSFPGACDGWVVRYCSFEDMGDNPIDNGRKDSGIAYGCFFSGVTVTETRPGTNDRWSVAAGSGHPLGQNSGDLCSDYDASAKVMEFNRCALWLKAKRYADVKPFNGTGSPGDPVVFIAWKGQATKSFNGIKWRLRNTTLRYDGTIQGQVAGASGNIWGNGQFLPNENVKWVFPFNTRASFPVSELPSGYPSGLTGVTRYYAEAGTYPGHGATANMAKTAWNEQVADVIARAGADMIIDDAGTFPGFGFGF